MESSKKIINYLQVTEPFSFLKGEDILWLADRLHEVFYPAGTIIFSEGDRGDKCYFIESGEVDVLYHRNGEDKHIATLSTHDIFGEIALLADSTRCVTIKVLKDCHLLELDRDDFNKLLHHSKEAFKAISDLVKDRNRPFVLRNVQTFHQQTPEGEVINVVNNQKLKTFLHLDDKGWVVWQHINGTNSLNKIYQAYQKEFKTEETEFVTDLLAELFRLGFIGFIFPEHAGITDEERLSFWQRLMKKIEI
jgi:hypothetical protein